MPDCLPPERRQDVYYFDVDALTGEAYTVRCPTIPVLKAWTEEEIQAANEVSEAAAMAVYYASRGDDSASRTGASSGRGKKRGRGAAKHWGVRP